MSTDSNPRPDKKIEKSKSVLHYSGMAIQMLATILGAVFLGKHLDSKGDEGQVVWTLTFTFLGLFLALYFMLRPFVKKS